MKEDRTKLAREIADYCIWACTENTETGECGIGYDEIEEKFGIDIAADPTWLDDIADAMDYDIVLDDFRDYSFLCEDWISLNCAGAFCPIWDEMDEEWAEDRKRVLAGEDEASRHYLAIVEKYGKTSEGWDYDLDKVGREDY